MPFYGRGNRQYTNELGRGRCKAELYARVRHCHSSSKESKPRRQSAYAQRETCEVDHEACEVNLTSPEARLEPGGWVCGSPALAVLWPLDALEGQ